MLRDAQSSMRHNYINGGPGVMVSGLAWIVAALITLLVTFQMGMLALFLGGMLIVPVSGLIESRMKGEVPTPDPGLTRLALFTLPLLFGGLFLGYVMSFQNDAYFFNVMAVAIGLRYLVFSRIYGLWAFISLGAALIAIGLVGHVLSTPLVTTPFAVGAVEIGFGLVLMRMPRD